MVSSQVGKNENYQRKAWEHLVPQLRAHRRGGVLTYGYASLDCGFNAIVDLSPQWGHDYRFSELDLTHLAIEGIGQRSWDQLNESSLAAMQELSPLVLGGDKRKKIDIWRTVYYQKYKQLSDDPTTSWDMPYALPLCSAARLHSRLTDNCPSPLAGMTPAPSRLRPPPASI